MGDDDDFRDHDHDRDDDHRSRSTHDNLGWGSLVTAFVSDPHPQPETRPEPESGPAPEPGNGPEAESQKRQNGGGSPYDGFSSAIEWGGNTLRIAIGAGGAILLTSFVQTLGSKLGERTAQALETKRGPRFPQLLRARPEPDEDDLQAAAFIDAVRSICARRPEFGGTLRLFDQESEATLLVHPFLPPSAAAQFRHLDLGDPRVAGATVAWTDTLGGHPDGAWATTSPPGVQRLVWDGEHRAWQPQRES